VEETNGMISMFPQSHMQKLLIVDVAHLRDLLDSLSIHHRVARSLDFLGAALKVVAGTPDAEDFEKIKFNEFQLINANNRQININSKVQDQINNITSTVNQLLRSAKGTQVDTGHLYEMLLSRNRMISMELQNLLLAIALAKANIVSPSILDHADLEDIWIEEPTDTPIKDLLSVASVKILQSDNLLYFVIKFPIIKSSCIKITVFPVSHHDTMLRLEDKIIADCNGAIHTVNNCSTTSGATFCQLAVRRSCAQELHAGGIAHCDIQHSDLHPITRVDEGIIIVNDRPARVSVDNGTYIHIRGTHLITFIESAVVNETRYVNNDRAQKRVPGVASSPSLNITMEHNILSLPYLHRLSERNLEHIKRVGENINDYHSHQIVLVAAAICCALICVGFTYRRVIQARRTTAQIADMIAQIGSAEDGLNSEGGVVN